MLRKVTKTIGRFKEGQEHDYPRAVWTKIANDAKMALDEFTIAIEANKVLQSALKRKPVFHRRAGATQ